MYLRWPSAYTVSKASVDFPEPDKPVMTTSWSRGISTEMFLRLCSAAPRIRMALELMKRGGKSCKSVSKRSAFQVLAARFEPGFEGFTSLIATFFDIMSPGGKGTTEAAAQTGIVRELYG